MIRNLGATGCEPCCGSAAPKSLELLNVAYVADRKGHTQNGSAYRAPPGFRALLVSLDSRSLSKLQAPPPATARYKKAKQ